MRCAGTASEVISRVSVSVLFSSRTTTFTDFLLPCLTFSWRLLSKDAVSWGGHSIAFSLSWHFGWL